MPTLNKIYLLTSYLLIVNDGASEYILLSTDIFYASRTYTSRLHLYTRPPSRSVRPLNGKTEKLHCKYMSLLIQIHVQHQTISSLFEKGTT